MSNGQENEGTFVYKKGAPGIPRKLAEGVFSRVFFGEQVMLSIVTIEPHTEAPIHSHPNEQWGYLLEGEWERIQGETSRTIIRRRIGNDVDSSLAETERGSQHIRRSRPDDFLKVTSTEQIARCASTTGRSPSGSRSCLAL